MVTIQCSVVCCQWRLHASKKCNKEPFRIKAMHQSHNCGGGICSTSHPKASKNVSTHVWFRSWRTGPCIQSSIFSKTYHVNMVSTFPISKLGWVKRSPKLSSMEVSYPAMIYYFNHQAKWWRWTRSALRLWIKMVSVRHALFSFQACTLGFKRGCRPLLFLDDTHLLRKYGDTLLGAIGKDVNNGFFHVAFDIVDNETNVN